MWRESGEVKEAAWFDPLEDAVLDDLLAHAPKHLAAPRLIGTTPLQHLVLAELEARRAPGTGRRVSHCLLVLARAVAGAIEFEEALVVRVRHPRLGLQDTEGHGDLHRAPGYVLDQAGKLGVRAMLAGVLHELRLAVHLGGEGPRVLGGDAAGELHRGRAHDVRAKPRVELVEVLVREDHADLVLPRLVQQVADMIIEVVVRLVNVDEAGPALLARRRRSLERRLRDLRDEEAAEDLAALAFEQILRRVDQDDLAALHRVKEIDLIFLVREHALEHGV